VDKSVLASRVSRATFTIVIAACAGAPWTILSPHWSGSIDKGILVRRNAGKIFLFGHC
jgi:hypothetical protein